MTAKIKIGTIALSAMLFIGTLKIQAQRIPLDPNLRTGKLANGFTYYIRHNEQPAKRVELYLVNKIGSVLEDEDQLGLAHFMEHMNFNGTRNFPKNDLVDYLQKAGVRFGADLNAYTSFDETVYQLPLPTDNPAMLANGLKIMRDWAQEATLDPSEIEKERGVILEEERLGKGAKDRMSRKYLPMLLNHARYADRLPIGKDAILTGFKPEVIKRFHHDWYRPDLQALIIVGDVDVNQTEKLVKEKFSDLKNPLNERDRTRYVIPLTGKGQFMVVTDKEETSTDLEIIMKHRVTELVTEQDYLTEVKRNLLNQLLNTRRYAELSKDASPAYTGVSIGVNGLLNNIDMLSFSVSAKEGRLEESFLQAWRMFERIKRHGFTQGELDRAKQNQLRSLQSNVSEKDKTSSVSYVKEYQNLFLHNEASPGIDWEYQFTKTHIGGITLADITGLMNEYLHSKDVDILVSAPERNRRGLPDSATVQSWITQVSNETIQPYKDELVNKPLLAVRPQAGTVVKKESLPQLNLTKLTLSNGVKVILKPTDFKNDQILYGAFAPGGTSLYDHADLDIASNASGLMARMGLGNLNPVELNQVLTGKVASSAAAIGLRSQTISAKASPQDLETALQLTYLQFTAPRKDTLIFKNTMANVMATLANRYASPANVFTDTMSYVLSNYSYRFSAPTVERISKITLDRAYDIYKECFSDASGFTFVFTGNFKPDSITPLIAQYLGSLPSTHKNVKARDLGIHIPEGIITKKVYKGSENKALVRIIFSGDYQYSPLANLELKALGEILQIKVLQQLREAESEVYSPQVQTAYNKYPSNRFSINVAFGCAPGNADHLVNLVEQELSELRDGGPQPDEIEKFKAQYAKAVELALNDNGFWLSYLLGQYENNENPLQALDSEKNLQQINATSLKQAAKTLLSGKNMITFQLLPEQGS
ncbi:insulinase family protein [Mucilaginibacter sabulilitoris]|uniref:Insulinase family protein n=1 Tax=Mucilaginibacter sabulilitoris TaxID=1173583 RepID=A0ABZ0TNK6_9SPHI|nr:insulinase family protein [Mucilaginibacter sabulilitoris]WPU94736.1 insulinase family protein [Mucilaginibacter sabulilitoris]